MLNTMCSDSEVFMNNLRDLRSRLTAGLPVFVFVLFVIQPLLDCVSFWFAELGWSNGPTLAVRMGLLAVTALLGFGLSRRKWIYWSAAAVCIAIGAGHLYALYDYGTVNDLFGDVTNYIRILQLPVTVLCMITFLRENEKCYDSMKWGMVISVAIVVVVEILSVLTDTDPHTYQDGKGVLGWFNNTNAQSNILCILAPVVSVFLYEKKGLKSLWFWLGTLGSFGVLYFLGTRLGLLGMVAAGFGLAVCQLLVNYKNWKPALAFALCCVVFLALLPWSPMFNHQGTYDFVQTNRQAIIDERLAQYDLKPLDEPGISEEELAARKALWVEALSYTYSYHAEDFVEIFGMEETIEHYNYSKDINTITEQRPKKLLFGRMLMEASPASAKLFGVELSRFTVGKNNYDVENDLHGIWFLLGGVGLAAVILFLLYFVWIILKALLKDAKTYFTLDAAAWGIGFVCCLLHIYCTAGVLRRPNSSFYLAAVLAAVYYLVKIKKYEKC